MTLHVLEHKEIYKGKIVRLVVDTVIDDDGKKGIREVVHHPGGAVIISMLPDERILFVRQFRYPMKRVLLELPAGKLDPGEAPEKTASRELEEETGYRAGRIEKILECYTSPGFCDELLHVYLAGDLRRAHPRPEVGEASITVESHTLEEALEMIGRGEIVDAKTIAGLLWWKAVGRSG